jgi:hypothetical protein
LGRSPNRAIFINKIFALPRYAVNSSVVRRFDPNRSVTGQAAAFGVEDALSVVAQLIRSTLKNSMTMKERIIEARLIL